MPSARRLPQAGTWLAVVAMTLVGALALAALGVPSPALFAGLLAGAAVALTVRHAPDVPRLGRDVSQGVLGVLIGLLVDPETLAELAGYWLPVLLIVLATLGVSLLAGLVMRRQAGIDATTGALAMVAGGASGLVAISRELGADEQVVGVIQNLRVIVIVVSMPLVVATVYGGGDGAVPTPTPVGTAAPWWVGVLVTALVVGVGWPLGRLLRLPAAALLGPLALTVAAELSGLLPTVTVPTSAVDVAFAVIGLSVGLGLTRASLAVVARALPLAATLVVTVIAACAGLGLALSAMTGLDPLDGYLATTPGGMSAVLATALDSGAAVTFVLAVQVTRLLIMIVTAPALAAFLRRAGSG